MTLKTRLNTIDPVSRCTGASSVTIPHVVEPDSPQKTDSNQTIG